MAKWSGEIGFVVETGDDYGVVETSCIERTYVGDFNKDYRRLISGVSVNDEVTINNIISVIADPFIANNFHKIRYATYMGIKWKVDSIDVLYPRITLNLGGEYTNG